MVRYFFSLIIVLSFFHIAVPSGLAGPAIGELDGYDSDDGKSRRTQFVHGLDPIPQTEDEALSFRPEEHTLHKVPSRLTYSILYDLRWRGFIKIDCTKYIPDDENYKQITDYYEYLVNDASVRDPEEEDLPLSCLRKSDSLIFYNGSVEYPTFVVKESPLLSSQ